MKNTIISHIELNKKKYLIFFCFFIAGIIIGIVCVKFLSSSLQADLINYLKTFFSSFLSSKETFDNLSYFKQNLYNEAKLYFLLWLSGLTIIGLGAAPFYVFLRGFVIGFTNSFIISNYGLKGLFYNIVTIIPQNLIKIPALFFACVCILSFSLKKTSDKSKIKKYAPVNANMYVTYTLFIFAAFVVSVLGVLIESYVIPYFIFIFTPDMV